MDVEPALRVLVVEDEPMIAMVVEDAIDMLGYQIVGPVARLDEALVLAVAGDFDCAILDINIRGGDTYEIASLLLSRDCPFVLATGYSEWSIPKTLTGAKRLTKPYAFGTLEEELHLMHARVQTGKQNRKGSEA